MSDSNGLEKELRTLKRQLQRSESDRAELEINKEKNDALLRSTIEQLQSTQNELIETAKMAALGELVAGVAHEVNTPLGTAITAASHVEAETEEIMNKAERGELTKSGLLDFFSQNRDTAAMVLRNLTRAADLIRSFKLVAVDRSVSGARQFNLHNYLNDILNSLSARLRKTRVQVSVEGETNVIIDSDPGLFSQVITNLIMNSLFHGYAEGEEGRVTITIREDGDAALLEYRDDGKGIPEDVLPKIFEPFFTTRRGQGGSGLGLSIISNIVTQQLGGSIDCDSKPGQGVHFRIRLPGLIRIEDGVTVKASTG